MNQRFVTQADIPDDQQQSMPITAADQRWLDEQLQEERERFADEVFEAHQRSRSARYERR